MSNKGKYRHCQCSFSHTCFGESRGNFWGGFSQLLPKFLAIWGQNDAQSSLNVTFDLENQGQGHGVPRL